jgi:hypothetical protein
MSPPMRAPRQCKELHVILLWTDSGMRQYATRTYEDVPPVRLISIRIAIPTRSQDRSAPGLNSLALLLCSPASRQGYTSRRSNSGLCR